MREDPNFDWAQVGFLRKPTPRLSVRGQVLFRAWGGRSSKKGNPDSDGVCFSTQRPASRSHAEELFSVFEYGNTCEFVTDFIVPQFTVLWWGQVDPGEPMPGPNPPAGVQVFIENWDAQAAQEVRTTKLENDLGGAWVHQGRTPIAKN